jgi:predicted ATP-grasp superfamily ATP-dependent carboligase
VKTAEKRLSVLIPDGESEFALFATHCLAPFPDVEVHVISSERLAPIRFSRFVKSYAFRPDLDDEESRLRAVRQAVERNRVNVLLPTATDWITFASANRRSLADFVAVADVPGSDALQLANNKWMLANFLSERGIPGPPTLLLTSDSAGLDQLAAMQFPVLLKPVSAWGGEGIERFDSFAEMKSFIARRGIDRLANQYIVQTELPGYVVGINVLAREGKILALTMQRGIVPNVHKFAAAGAVQFVNQPTFAETAEHLVSSLNWSGFANLDTLYDSTDGQIKILEINARFWGSLRGSLVAGVSFPYLACMAALNIPFDVPEYTTARYIHSTTAIREGLLRLRGKARVDKFPLSETGIRFLVSDPIAEGLRAFQQQIAPDILDAA